VQSSDAGSADTHSALRRTLGLVMTCRFGCARTRRRPVAGCLAALEPLDDAHGGAAAGAWRDQRVGIVHAVIVGGGGRDGGRLRAAAMQAALAPPAKSP
jgi:hypothetical protein